MTSYEADALQENSCPPQGLLPLPNASGITWVRSQHILGKEFPSMIQKEIIYSLKRIPVFGFGKLDNALQRDRSQSLKSIL